MKRRLFCLDGAGELYNCRHGPVLFHVTGVTDGSGYWQGGSSGLSRMRAIRSVEERNVAGRYIHHVNAQRVQCFALRGH